MTAKEAIFAILLIASLLTCGIWYAITHPPIRAGYIVDKDYHPACDWDTIEWHTIGKNHHAYCTTYHHHLDQFWSVTIDDRGQQSTWSVGHQRWEQCQIGLWFNCDTQVLLSMRPGPSQAEAAK